MVPSAKGNHTPYMQPTREAVLDELNKIHLKDLKVPMIHSVDAAINTDAQKARQYATDLVVTILYSFTFTIIISIYYALINILIINHYD